MKHGLFITFEGIDGSGKTTASKRIYEALTQQNYDVIYTREPGGIDIAEQIRNVILDVENHAMDVKTEALLYTASRRQHLIEKIIPALHENKIVICDRFLDSSLAYQGFARGIGIDEVLQLNQFAIENYMPNATLYFEVDVEEGLRRVHSRKHKDRLDKEDISFHQSVKEGYEIINDMFKDRIYKINANLSEEEVFQNALATIIEVIEQYV